MESSCVVVVEFIVKSETGFSIAEVSRMSKLMLICVEENVVAPAARVNKSLNSSVLPGSMRSVALLSSVAVTLAGSVEISDGITDIFVVPLFAKLILY